jgi:hypothetical protein
MAGTTFSPLDLLLLYKHTLGKNQETASSKEVIKEAAAGKESFSRFRKASTVYKCCKPEASVLV